MNVMNENIMSLLHWIEDDVGAIFAILDIYPNNDLNIFTMLNTRTWTMNIHKVISVSFLVVKHMNVTKEQILYSCSLKSGEFVDFETKGYKETLRLKQCLWLLSLKEKEKENLIRWVVHRVLEQHIQFYLFAVIILMLGAAFHVKMIVFNSENIHIILIFEYSGLILNNIHINISRFKFAKLLQFFLQCSCVMHRPRPGLQLRASWWTARQPLLFMGCYYCFINISKQEYSLVEM